MGRNSDPKPALLAHLLDERARHLGLFWIKLVRDGKHHVVRQRSRFFLKVHARVRSPGRFQFRRLWFPTIQIRHCILSNCSMSRATASHLHLHLNAIANAPCFVSADADALDLHEARSAHELPQLSKIYGHDAEIIQRGR